MNLEGPKALTDLLAHLETQSREAPDDLGLLQKLARLHFRNGNARESLRMYQHILAQAPENIIVQIELGLAHLHLGNHDEARFCLERAHELHPRFAQVHLAFAKLAEKEGSVERQVESLLHAAAAAPDRADIPFVLGELMRRYGDFAGAIRQYQAALAIQPHLENARFGLAGLLIRLGRINEAMAHLREILRHNPSAYDAHFNLGQCLHRQRKFSLAISHLSTALRGKTSWDSAKRILADCYFQIGDWDRALVAMEELVAAHPDREEDAQLLGELHQKVGECDLAAEVFRNLARQHPDKPQYVMSLVRLLLPLGRLNEAQAVLKDLFKRHPGHLEGHCLYGETLLAAGQPKDALDEFRKTLLVKEAYVPGLRGAAAVCRRLNLVDDERDYLRQIVAVTPEDPMVLLRLGELEQRRGDASSLERFRRVAELAPDSDSGKEAAYHLRHAGRVSALRTSADLLSTNGDVPGCRPDGDACPGPSQSKAA